MPQPDRDCPICPRLVAFRATAREAEPDWFNAPVPVFGDRDARMLIVGLAPGLRGANRTGRPFTGDYAGVLLYETLAEFGFSHGRFDARPDDSLVLQDCAIVNAVRCVPPQNKPTPAEITNCRPFLSDALRGHRRVCAILTLGRIAHESVIRALGEKPSRHGFKHGRRYDDLFCGERPLQVFASYHCSRYNTNTGLLTAAMFRAVVGDIRSVLDQHR